MNETERIIYLRQQLHEHNHNYYVLNQPTITDQEFDMLMHELQDLESRHPEMADPNSPSQRVGSDLNQNFTQVAHKYLQRAGCGRMVRLREARTAGRRLRGVLRDEV